ncbi:MAG: SU10 major capsid protein [Bacteroidales bacterium]
MTVLKSLDLKGNKQSFAGWISNMSPCDTPFISMIGKEGIDETQYSWQMDALDKPKNDGFEEGSIAEPEKREPTHILHNFTSILRKVANVSDTVAAIGTHGRAKEMEYQMGKAGKELKRDMEFMYLNNEIGNIGTSSQASKCSGFIGLCAPKGYVDFYTGAKTFKEVKVANESGPWFKTSDLFDLTYNLFLAGSKANKIMYHPRHATTFSDFIGHSFEANQTFRMFDNVDTKYNSQVNKIRDPLGQNYDLIPNRFMPADKIYIFNDADWTQMVLRAPSATKLAKNGASERFLLEAEVGLRHRHINASGVLSMDPSTLLMTWEREPSPLTWGVNHNEEAEIAIVNRATGQPIPGGTTVNWSSSNTAVLHVTDSTGQTNVDGKATNMLIPQKAGTSIVSAVCGDSRASYIVTVEDPSIRLTLASPQMEKKTTSLATVQVLKADGSPVEDGIMVSFKANPSSMVTFDSITAPTENNTGVAKVEMTAENTLGLVQVQANVGAALSNYARLEIVEKVEVLVMRIDRRSIAHGINDSTTLAIEVVDSKGAAIPSQPVSLTSTDPTVVNIVHNDIVTDGTTGLYGLVLTSAGAKGTTDIVAKYKEQELVIRLTVADPDIVLGCPESAQEGVEFNMSAVVSRDDGSAVKDGVIVSFTSDPAFSPAVADTPTAGGGIARAHYTPNSNSDLEITASVGNVKSNMCKVAVTTP